MKNINNCRGALLLLACAIGGCEYALDNHDLLRRGESALRAGEYRAAVVDFRNVVRSDARHADARVLLAEALLGMGEPGSALAEVDKSLELGAADTRTALVKARALLALDRPEEALQAAAASTASSERSPANTVRGEASVRLRRLAEARTFYESAVAEDPKNVVAWAGLALATEDAAGSHAVLERATRAVGDAMVLELARGTLQNREQRFEDAAGTFAKLVARATREQDARLTAGATLGLIEAEIGLGKNQEAYDRASKLLKDIPTSVPARALMARAAFVLGRYEEARQLLQQLLAHFPDRVGAKLLLGAVNYAERNFAQADMYLSAVLAADPENAFARRLLAETRLREQHPERALATLAEGGLEGENRSLAARINLQTGNVAAGLELLEKGVAADPGNRAAQLELATAYLSAGRYVPALKVLESLPPSEKAPDRRDYLLIFAAARMQDYPRAIRLSHELIDQHPASTPLYVVAASYEALAGRIEDARRTLGRALESRPADTAVLLALARLELQDSKLDTAQKHAHAALTNRPESAAAAITLAGVAAARDDESGVRSWLEKAIEWAPRSAQPRALLARYHLLKGEYVQAHQLAQAAASLAGDDAMVLDLLGETAARVGRSVEALDTVRAGASRAQRSAGHQLALARASLSAGRIDDALTAARSAVALEPRNLQANVLLASLLTTQADMPAATAMVASLKRDHGEHPAVLALEGDLAVRTQRFAEAARLYGKAGEKVADPSFAARMQLLAGQASVQQGDPQAAIAAFEKVLATQPDDAVALNNLAWLYFERNRVDEAVKLAQRAYTLRPKIPAIIDTYAWILVQRGETARGIRLLEQAVALSPGDATFRQHLAQAQTLAQSTGGKGG